MKRFRNDSPDELQCWPPYWLPPSSADAPTLEDNMAASKKANLVPGKQLHVADQGDSLVFCEVALITGTSKANAIADFYNSTGTDICTPEKFAALDKAKIHEETGATGSLPQSVAALDVRSCSMSSRTASSGPSAASR